MHRMRAILLVLMAGPAIVTAQARPAPLKLSFADAVTRATTAAPTVTLAGLRISEAGGRLREARGALLPSFAISAAWVNRTFNSKSFGFTFPTIPGQPPFPELVGPFNNYDARLTANQTLLDFASFARVRAAEAQADGSDADQRTAVEAVAQGAALAYLRGTRALSVVNARRADSSIAAELVRLAEDQRSAGVSAAIDVTRARTQLAVAEGQLIVARNEAERARLDLARTLGLDPGTPLELVDTLSDALAAIATPTNRDSAVAGAIASRPDLRAEVAHGVAARRASSAISAERLPRLGIEGD